MAALCAGGKCRATYSSPTASPSAPSTRATPRFQRSRSSCGPGEGAAVEVEVRRRPRRRRGTGPGRGRRATAASLPASSTSVLGPRAGEAGDEGRLATTSWSKAPSGAPSAVRPGRQSKPGARGDEVRRRHRVVGQVGLAGPDHVPVAPRRGRSRASGPAPRRPIASASSASPVRASMRRDVRDVGVADRRVTVLAVVGLVRQAEAGLAEVDDVSLGVVEVGVHPVAHGPADAGALQRAQRPASAPWVAGGVERVEVGARAGRRRGRRRSRWP